jgi:large subunit ribosomal protein L21
MEKYVVLKIGTRQYTVRENEVFEVERQEKPVSADVLFYSDGAKTLLGDPVLKDVSVKLVVVSEKRERKIRVNRFKAKSRYRKGKGHRQSLSIIKVGSISLGGEKAEKTVQKPEQKVEAAKKQAKPVKATAKAAKPAKIKKKAVKTAKKASKKLPRKVK